MNGASPALKQIKAGLEELGIAPLSESSPGSSAVLLERFIREIEIWNPKYKLVGPKDNLIERHLMDSLNALPLIQQLGPRTLADVGSGAGFPGIPLAVFLPECEVTLIEKMGRRAGFLRNVAAALELKNVRVLEEPVESINANAQSFNVITFRAWTAVNQDTVNMLRPLLEPGGWIVAYKGRSEVVAAEMDAVRPWVAAFRLEKLSPGRRGEERHLMLLQPGVKP